jgi:adenylate cyclase
VTSEAGRTTPTGRRRPRLLLTILLLLPLVLASGPAREFVGQLQARIFDTYQWLTPRERHAFPVVVVAIDDHSLERYGQWPWSRLQVASLIDAIADGGALALGIDILFREPDRLSPENYALGIPDAARGALTPMLEALPRHDPALARSLSRLPSVLAVALERAGGRSPGRPATQVRLSGQPPAIPRFEGSRRSLPVIEAGAESVAMINAQAEDGRIRRIPLFGRLGEETFSNLGLETLRLAIAADFAEIGESSLTGRWVVLGEARIPIDEAGRAWLWWSAPSDSVDAEALPVVSAADVLAGTLNPETFRDRVVLLGFVAQGQLDRITTSLGDQRPGVHAHAELIESIVEGQVLQRPVWAGALETLAYLLLAAACALAIRSVKPWQIIGTGVLPLMAWPAIAFVAFRQGGVLIDGVLPAAGASLFGVTLLSMHLAASRRARRELEAHLQQEREAKARAAGELAAAARIQTGLLPQPSALAQAGPRVEVASHMTAARTVGGDLYDYQLIDRRLLFISIGDVSDKGVPASLFMALTQSLLRSAVRQYPEDLPRAVAIAAEQLERDNPEGMFVTWVGLTLDLDSGMLGFVNAGHEHPLLGRGADWRPLTGDSGPPLCALPDFPWVANRSHWPAGATLLLYTDGLTEALAPDGSLYGRSRLASFLASRGEDTSPEVLITELLAEVISFADGRELPDDLALVALRYHGPRAD